MVTPLFFVVAFAEACHLVVLCAMGRLTGGAATGIAGELMAAGSGWALIMTIRESAGCGSEEVLLSFVECRAEAEDERRNRALQRSIV